jgi:drug/metabolite transporter (DMT)-like permease
VGAGACVVAGGAVVVEGFGTADAAALAWSAVALACEVAFTVVAAPALRSISPLGLSLRACAAAAVLLAVGSVLLEGTAALTPPDRAELLAIGYLAVLSTAVAFLLWYEAVRRLGAETAGLVSGLMPVAAAVAGALVGAAPLRWQTLGGACLVAAGLTLALARGRGHGHGRGPGGTRARAVEAARKRHAPPVTTV